MHGFLHTSCIMHNLQKPGTVGESSILLKILKVAGGRKSEETFSSV